MRVNLIVVFTFFCACVAFSEEEKKWNEDLLMEGDKLSGELGTYGEYRDTEEGTDNNFSFATAYTRWNYQTARMGKLKLGMELFTHSQLSNWHDENVSDRYDTDIEGKHWYLPELWVDYAFTKDTHLRLGRFAHSKISHVDDSHAEGFYLESKVDEKLTLILGAVTSIAEIDYDDGEDFGRKNDSQDFSDNDYYGHGSSKWVYFLEARYEACDWLNLNPYLITQPGYGTQTGLDIKMKTEFDNGCLLGLNLYLSHLNEDLSSDVTYKGGTGSDAFIWSVLPYMNWGDFKFKYGFVQYDGDGTPDDATNISWSGWIEDHMGGLFLDQEVGYGEQNCTEQYAMVGWYPKDSGFWTHVAIGKYDYGWDKEKSATELEFKTGYKFGNGLDCEIRFFDVHYNDQAGNNDYNKVEARVRYCF